ncbi:MAG: cytidylate kinase-like family protein [Odoribacter sp.]
MEKKIIVTIGRQFGSGGRTVGKKLAEQLGIAYYDKELINLASKESGICGEFFEKADERTSGSLLKALAMGFSMNNAIFQSNDYLSNESLFQIQSDVIRKVADEQSCVLVGRCADYILRENKNCVNVFISACLKDRIRRAMEYNHIEERNAEEYLQKADKSRASYYNYYTDKIWGAADSYDLCINSSLLGIDETVDFVRQFVQKKIF